MEVKAEEHIGFWHTQASGKSGSIPKAMYTAVGVAVK
jgi:hypothetical protein